MQVRYVATLAELDAILATSGDAIVCIDFTATWCGPCQQIAPAFEMMSTELPDVVFLKVDVDENEVCFSSNLSEVMEATPPRDEFFDRVLDSFTH